MTLCDTGLDELDELAVLLRRDTVPPLRCIIPLLIQLYQVLPDCPLIGILFYINI
jgi:hypothetical protein